MSFGDAIVRHPASIVITIILVTVFFALQIKSIATTSDTDVYLPDNEEARMYKEIKSEYGSTQIALVIAESREGDIFTRQAMIDLLKVEWALENNSHINKCFLHPGKAGNVVSLVDLIAGVIAELTDEEDITRADIYTNLTEPNSVWVQTFNQWFTVLRMYGYFENWENATYFDGRCMKAALHLIFNVVPEIERSMNTSFGIPEEMLSYIIKIISKDLVYKNEDIGGNYLNIKAKATLAIVQFNNSMPREDVTAAQVGVENLAYDMEARGEAKAVRFIVFGPKLITRDINDSANRSLMTLLPIAFIAIILILVYSFRTFLDTILSLVTLGFAIIWMYGLANMLNFTLTTISIAAPILLIGLGIDYAIHIILHYRHEIRSGYGVEDAMRRTVASVGAAILLSVLTTMAGFMANIFSDLTAIIQFGLLCAIGIGSSFLISNTFIPAIKVMVDRRRARKGKPILPKFEIKKMEMDFEGSGEGGKDLRRLSAFSIGAYGARHHAGAITAVAVIITLTSAYIATHLGYSFDDREFLPEDTPIKKTISYLENNFDISTSYVSVWVQGDITDPNILYAINGTIGNMYDDEYVIKPGGVPQTESIVTYMQTYYTTMQSTPFKALFDAADPVDKDKIPDRYIEIIYQWLYEDEMARSTFRQYAHYSAPKGNVFDAFLSFYSRTNGVNESYIDMYTDAQKDGLINDSEKNALLTLCFSSPEIMERMDSYFKKNVGTFDGTVIRVYVRSMRNEEVPNLIKELNEDTKERHDILTQSLEAVSEKIVITDGPILGYIIMNSIQENQRNSIAIMVIIAAIMLSVVFRMNMHSATLGFITSLPIVFVVAWILASLYIMGLTINVMTTMIAALTIGLGIDYSIHISYQFIENLSVLRDRGEAMIVTTNTTGKALMGASLTTIGGFVVLTLSPLPPLRQFGGITALTIIYSIIAAIYILPSMLTIWSKGKEDMYSEDVKGMKYMEYECKRCKRSTIVRLKERKDKLMCPYCGGVMKYKSPVNIKAIESSVSPYLYIIKYHCPSCNKGFEVKSTRIKNTLTCPYCGFDRARVVMGLDGKPKARPLSPYVYYTPAISYLSPRTYPYANQYYYNYPPYAPQYVQQMGTWMGQNIGKMSGQGYGPNQRSRGGMY